MPEAFNEEGDGHEGNQTAAAAADGEQQQQQPPREEALAGRSEGGSTKNSSGGRPRQYLYDRCKGVSKYPNDRKLPCFACHVPLPVYYASGCMEQNALCECTGRLGLVDPKDIDLRKNIFTVGLGFNFVALLFSVFACCAISSKNYHLIKAAAFSDGILNVPAQFNMIPLRFYVGLTAVVFDDPNGRFATRIIPFNEFCVRYAEIDTLVAPEQCGQCKDSSSGLVTAMLLSCLLILPSMNSDVLRMYVNYDVNCQKFIGSILTMLSIVSGVMTFVQYSQNCFASLYEGDLLFSRVNDTLVMNSTNNYSNFNNSSFVDLKVAWTAGNGLICVYVATVLKIVDVLAHLLVPTPTITRDREEQQAYEDRYGPKPPQEEEEEQEQAQEPEQKQAQ